MGEYKFKREEFFRFNKSRMLSTMLTGPVLFIIIAFVGFKHFSSNGYILIAAVLVGGLLGQVREIIQLKNQWDGFCVDIDEMKITKHQFKTEDLIFNKDEIKIVEIPSSGLSISDGEVGKYLFIPKFIEGYDNIKEELMKWRTIEVLPVNTVNSQKRIMYMTFYKSKNRV